ncbi:MAG: hypothetical protein E6R13_09240 [Spirochaetes bacterium]|nr:MAG: hypothetical protein E6R13_09240 [Spirochaetota bacterium]
MQSIEKMINYDGLNKHLNDLIADILKQTVIRAIIQCINDRYPDVSLFLFGGALRNLVSEASGNHRYHNQSDVDIVIVGGDRSGIKSFIRRKFRHCIRGSADYFGANPQQGNISVVQFQNRCVDIDFVFAEDIPDEVLDFDVNGMYLYLDDRNPEKVYSWKDIRLGMRRSNQKLKQLFRNILEKKCTPTHHILEQFAEEGENSWKKAINRLYRFIKMLKKGYQIQCDEWEKIVVEDYKKIEWAIEWYRKRNTISFDEMDKRPDKEKKFYSQHMEKLRIVDHDIKEMCLNHIAEVSITMIPFNLPTYVQLWILEFEFPLSNCITQFEKIRCLEKVQKSRDVVIEWRNRSPDQQWMSLQTYLWRR